MPMEALKEGVSTSEGTGMMMSTLLAMERDLNWLLAWRLVQKNGRARSVGWWSTQEQECPRDAGAHLDHVLDAGVGVRLHHGLHPDERLDVRGEPVRHEIELPVRRDEGDGAVVLEPVCTAQGSEIM